MLFKTERLINWRWLYMISLGLSYFEVFLCSFMLQYIINSCLRFSWLVSVCNPVEVGMCWKSLCDVIWCRLIWLVKARPGRISLVWFECINHISSYFITSVPIKSSSILYSVDPRTSVFFYFYNLNKNTICDLTLNWMVCNYMYKNWIS